MDYLFEQLDADTFQELCQALLVKDYPDLQCFPVGQPDGGRDALSRLGDGDATTVGQVKFKRQDTPENAQWAIDALQGELEKVRRLHELGRIERYLLMTNARGSAHLDNGMIDRVQAWLDDNFPVPAQVLWRRDLAARLDNSNDLRLRYPSLLTGEAALSLIVSSRFGNEQKRLDAVLKTFIAEQYRKDEEVKFREVDLADSLLSLFVDVPTDLGSLVIGSRRGASTSHELRAAMSNLISRVRGRRVATNMDPEFQPYYSHMVMGTADLLLSEEAQASLPRVLLQGAPGQGKSTLAQYVCQVHRARYLGKGRFIEQLPKHHQAAAFRLPIKVDLRDAADFFDGQKFLGHGAEDMESHRTLERFLAHLISIEAGGASFSVDDLRLILPETPVLLFLDGLDEVADLSLRERLVARVTEGVGRLSDLGSKLQVVMTSRPAQLGRMPRYTSDFTRVALDPLGSKTVLEYANKWAAAKHLDADRAAEVLSIMQDKLSQAHIRELTKNPMQLTILLSLVLTSGNSLPDIRTDLYAKYVDTFMTRESEKDAIVSQHRALLLEVVEYLAWKLQSSAEAGRASGSIAKDALYALVQEYLSQAEQKDDILEDIFDRGLERVYVLVQRVEGLYEFEVQPLREYFAARYLYTTAPVASFRQDHLQGDRAQRFEAMAVNPYWSNVTRFYAGFYHGGELGAIETSLEELVASEDIAASLAARSIGALLLADRTFVSKRRIQNKVVKLVFDPIGVQLLALTGVGVGDILSLPEDSGREELAEILFRQHIITGGAPHDFAIAGMLARNGGQAFRAEFVEWICAAQGIERTNRLITASYCGGLDDADSPELERIIFGDSPSSWIIRDRTHPLITDDAVGLHLSPALADRLAQSLMDWGGFSLMRAETDLAWVAHALDGNRASPVMVTREQTKQILPPGQHQVYEELRAAFEGSEGPDKTRVMQSYGAVVAAVEKSFGHPWAVLRLGLRAAVAYRENAELEAADDKTSVLNWGASVRLSRAPASRWVDRLSAKDSGERLFWLSALLGWGRSAEVHALRGRAEEMIDGLDDVDYWRLILVLRDIFSTRASRGGRLRKAIVASAGASGLVRLAFDTASGKDLSLNSFEEGAPPRTLVLSAFHAKARQQLAKYKSWKDLTPADGNVLLAELRKVKPADADALAPVLPRGLLRLPAEMARAIVRDAPEYPIDVTMNAIDVVQNAYKPDPVLRASQAGHWVFQ